MHGKLKRREDGTAVVRKTASERRSSEPGARSVSGIPQSSREAKATGGRLRGVWGTSDGSAEAGVGQRKGDEFLGQVESIIQEVCGHVRVKREIEATATLVGAIEAPRRNHPVVDPELSARSSRHQEAVGDLELLEGCARCLELPIPDWLSCYVL